MEVTLTREERIEYARWRNDRDIVREEKPAPKKDNEKEKEKDKGKDKEKDKKVFVDKVLEKALQLLRKEIKKAARDIVPETGRA
jgi:hypothetical protein